MRRWAEGLIGLTHLLLLSKTFLDYPMIARDWNSLSLGTNDVLFSRLILAWGCIAAVLFSRGKFHIGAVLSLFAVWQFLLLKNNMIRNAATEFLVWMTVASLFDGPDRRLGLDHEIYLRGAWFMFGLNYFYSAITKLQSAFWRDGSAIDGILQSSIGRVSPLNDLIQSSHLGPGLGYLVIYFELSILFLAFNRRTRLFAWAQAMLIHIGLASTLRLWPLSLVMLVCQVRFFDPGWVSGALRKRLEVG